METATVKVIFNSRLVARTLSRAVDGDGAHAQTGSHFGVPLRVICKKLTLLAIIAGSCAACAEIAPYERGRLAHPTMAPADAESLGRAHVHSVHEGAVGGTPGASSGCGCN
ncbi:MAG TPA: DUF4266 domain-containing protein [Polyangiaceae bacterium]